MSRSGAMCAGDGTWFMNLRLMMCKLIPLLLSVLALIMSLIALWARYHK